MTARERSVFSSLDLSFLTSTKRSALVLRGASESARALTSTSRESTSPARSGATDFFPVPGVPVSASNPSL
jgi:hypothetical protein